MYKKFLIFFAMLGISSALIAGGGGRTNHYFGNTNSLESSLEDNSVTVVYDGSSATVTVADNVADYLTVTQSGAHVSIAQSSDLASEITYTLSGSSTDGEFYMSGSYKATIELNGLTLTNTTPVYSGAAIHIQNSKRINVKVVTGTTNTLVDAASGSQKGCLYVKGHAEFKQKGTLNVVGNVKHGIKAGEYISIKNATINVTSAVGDGISCNQYFLMESGTVNISGTDDDGIQCDLDGDTPTGITTDHEDEDSGNVYISGGTITITCDAIAAKGIKSAGDIYISDEPVINITTTGIGTWDEEDLETKAACCLNADGNIDISGGMLSLTSTGSGGKGMKCDTLMTISGGDITVATSGGLYYNNGITENTNYTGNTDHINNAYYSSPKGIKAGTKTEVGTNNYIYSGGLIISGGTIYVTTSGHNGEGIESKNYFDIMGGHITVESYDDGFNAGRDMNITGGYVYSRTSNNDGMDSNGNFYIRGGLVYAIGASSPEVAIDANTEGGYKLYVLGGTMIAIGGIESGASLQQACYRASSVSSNTWHSMTYGNNAIAFLTPTINSGGGPGGGGPGGGGPGGGGPGGGGPGGNSSAMIISAPSTPTLKKNVTVTGGTSLFGGKCYLDATFSGGSNVSLSNYSSSGSGSGSLSYRFNIAGNWSTASNWSSGLVPGSGAEVYINADCQLDTDAQVTGLSVARSKVLTLGSGQSLTVSGDLTNTSASGLVIADGAQLANSSGNVKATIQKNISAYSQNGGWYFIASPMSTSVTPSESNGLLNGSYDLYLFDETEELEWRNYKANAFTTIENTLGYLYANSDDVTLAFAGTLVPSDNNVELTGLSASGTHFNQWNLIGNPFPCNAYLGDGQAFYKMNDAGDEIESVVAGTAIAPMEAVFVEATSATFSKTPSRFVGNLNIKLMSNDKTRSNALRKEDNAIVTFGEGCTLGKYMLNKDASILYIPQEDHEYAIVNSGYEDEVPLCFKASENGTYTLAIDAENVEMNYLHFIDNLTGIDTDLLAVPNYTFVANTTDYANRFHLVFSAEAIFVYFNGSDWVVSNEGNATLQLIDMKGCIIKETPIDGNTTLGVDNLTPGVYVIRLISNGEVKTQKVSVK